jgi:hypothetical protein
MGLAHWRTSDGRFAERAGDRTHHCASALGDRQPDTAHKRRGHDDGSTIELRLYLPRRAWHFTVTRKRTAPVEQTDDDRDQVAGPAVS